jgi:hypothetical protein
MCDSLHHTFEVNGGFTLAATNEGNKNAGAGSTAPGGKIDPEAPAGSKESLGAESVRDGRPATDDSTVEAMDEEGGPVE